MSGVRRSWPSEASSADFSSSLRRATRRLCAPRATAPARSRWPRRRRARRASPLQADVRPRPSGRTGVHAHAKRHKTDDLSGERNRPVTGAWTCLGTGISGSHRVCKGRRELPPIRAPRDGSPLRAHPSRSRAAGTRRRNPARTAARSRVPGRQCASRLSVRSSTSRLRSKRRAISSRRSSASRALARTARRQIARHEADGEKRKERHPVLRVRDRQRADRRQKEEVERHHRRHRRRHGEPERARWPPTTSTMSRNVSATIVALVT